MTTPVTHRAVSAGTTIKAAEDAGADQDARAAQYLNLARADLADALKYESGTDGRNHALDRAGVDAELALALARDSAQRTQAVDAQRKVNDLKSQLASKETTP